MYASRSKNTATVQKLVYTRRNNLQSSVATACTYHIIFLFVFWGIFTIWARNLRPFAAFLCMCVVARPLLVLLLRHLLPLLSRCSFATILSSSSITSSSNEPNDGWRLTSPLSYSSTILFRRFSAFYTHRLFHFFCVFLLYPRHLISGFQFLGKTIVVAVCGFIQSK